MSEGVDQIITEQKQPGPAEMIQNILNAHGLVIQVIQITVDGKHAGTELRLVPKPPQPEPNLGPQSE